MSNYCANFHCDNITLRDKVRCGSCRGKSKTPLCCCCDAELKSQRAFRCDSCKKQQENFKQQLWQKNNSNKHG